MSEAIADPRLQPGANFPPQDPIDTLLGPVLNDLEAYGVKSRAERVAEIVRAANAWQKALGESGIQTEEQASKAEDFLAQIRAEVDLLEEKRLAAGKPHRDALDKIQKSFAPLGQLLRGCTDILKPLKARWLDLVDKRQRAEAARIAKEAADAAEAAEEARKQAASGEDAIENTVLADHLAERAEELKEQASEAAALKPSIIGNFTGRASGYRTVWSARIVNVTKALNHYKTDKRLLETLQKIANEDARKQHENLSIPGVEAVSTRAV